MADKIKETTSEKLEKFIFKNRKLILSVVSVLVVAAIGICVSIAVCDANTKKGLAAIDSIEYAYTAKSQDLSDSDVAARQDKAIADVAEYCKKSGIVGVRANMVAADVYFAKKDFASSLNAYVDAVAKGKYFYTAPICNYNAGACSEELGNKDDAVKYYLAAAESKDFYLSAHAYFNAARVKESLGDVSGAAELYRKVVDGYSNDVWANLSQSRIIDLQSKGKID